MDPVSTLLPPSDTRTAPPNAFSSMSSEGFMRIIFAELANQDPLKPNDSSKLVQDLANVRSIQSDIDLSDKLKSLVTENQLASAGNMIGAYVSGVSEDNQRVEGLVISISRTADGPVLNLANGYRVQLRNIDEVIDPRFLAPPEDPEDPQEPQTPLPVPVTPGQVPPGSNPRGGSNPRRDPVTPQTPLE